METDENISTFSACCYHWKDLLMRMKKTATTYIAKARDSTIAAKKKRWCKIDIEYDIL